MITANCIHCGRLIEVETLNALADCGCCKQECEEHDPRYPEVNPTDEDAAR